MPVAAIPLVFAAALPAHAGTVSESVLHDFQGSDGSYPVGGLIQGSDGNFYSTTSGGGANGSGTIFMITPAGAVTQLYAFGAFNPDYCGKSGCSPPGPDAGLTLGADGNYYGTTYALGANATGSVFKITPTGNLTTLHEFGAVDSNKANTDGANPLTALTLGADGNFYGTTDSGGPNGTGTVFRITPGGTLTTLHAFGAQTAPSSNINQDGIFPRGVLLQTSDGFLYGTARGGGAHAAGTVFKINAAGSFSIVYQFDATPGNSSFPPYAPEAGLVLGADGNFYGTASAGGAGGSGVIFKLTTTGVLTTLYEFSRATPGATFTNSDGDNPFSALTLGSDGNFYGTAQQGGSAGYGTFFKITPAGAFTTLHSFGTSSSDGGKPDGSPLQAGNGNFYGTTCCGPNLGTVYELSLAASGSSSSGGGTTSSSSSSSSGGGATGSSHSSSGGGSAGIGMLLGLGSAVALRRRRRRA